MSAASIFLYIVVHNIHASLDPIPSKLFNWRIYFFFFTEVGGEWNIDKEKKEKKKWNICIEGKYIKEVGNGVGFLFYQPPTLVVAFYFLTPCKEFKKKRKK